MDRHEVFVASCMEPLQASGASVPMVPTIRIPSLSEGGEPRFSEIERVCPKSVALQVEVHTLLQHMQLAAGKIDAAHSHIMSALEWCRNSLGDGSLWAQRVGALCGDFHIRTGCQEQGVCVCYSSRDFLVFCAAAL